MTQKQQFHSFREDDIKKLQKEEKMTQQQEEKEMDNAINFNNTLNGARRIKKKPKNIIIKKRKKL